MQKIRGMRAIGQAIRQQGPPNFIYATASVYINIIFNCNYVQKILHSDTLMMVEAGQNVGKKKLKNKLNFI